MDPLSVDQIRLNFNAQTLLIINIAVGLMMLGVAIDLKWADFKRMILVAACPGGNLSNLMTYLAKGNTAISISMTAVSTMAAIVMTPLNLTIWGSLNPDTAPILQKISLSPLDVFFTVFIILIVLGALAANWEIFLDVIGLIMLAVLIHNALALNIGYWSARVFRLPERDSRAVAIEVGIQNSGLGLVLVFNFFGGLGGMAILVGWWGIWHIAAGLITAFIFTRFALQDQASESVSG